MFRPWHPSSSRQRGSTSNRATQQHTTSSRPLSLPEDAQPNESVDKHQRCPPAINSVATQQPLWRAGQGSRRNTQQFVAWEPSGSMGRAPPSTFHGPQTTGGTPAPPNAAPPTRSYARRSADPVSTASALPSEPPPPKRRKLGRPAVPQTRPGPLTRKMVPASTPSMSPVSSETLVGENGVKKERSISPELSSTEPRLITAGSKRYAPLPPECMKSQPNYKAARSAWARKEQDALRRLGLTVVRAFVREDGMVIDWETTADTDPAAVAAIIEPAVLLDRPAVPDPSVQSVKLTTLSLPHTSRNLNQTGIERERSRSPSVVEIAPPRPLEDRGGIEGSSSSSVVGKMSNPPGDINRGKGSRQHGHPSAGRENTIDMPVHTARLRTPPRVSARNSPSDHSRHQTASEVPSHTAPPPSGQTRKQSTSPQTPFGPSQRHTTSPRLSQSLPSPSQRAIDTLHNILHLKRQFGRDSPELLKPPALSPLPSPLRKLYPLPRTPQSGSPSRRSPGSSADAVAAAINEGTRRDRQGPSSLSTPMPSTPLRVYKKRSSSLAIPMQRNEDGVPSHWEEERQARHSRSSGRHSTPPIAVLGPRDSSPESQNAPSSVFGDEYDELELSYPSSPLPPPSVPLPDSHPPSDVPIDPPRPAEPVEQAVQPSLLDLGPPSPDENAAMRSSALRYLERYCQIFDMDRRALAEAYAPDAAFSCSSRNLRVQGRDGILDALQALGPGILCSGHSVEYDVTYLCPSIGVLLVALGIMSGTRDRDNNIGEVGYAMSFVLRPGREDQERPAGEPRPLVAAVHQMVLRDDPLRVRGAPMS